jgi:hypothetical protein
VTAKSSKQQTVGTPTPAGVIHINIPTTLPEMDKPQTSAGSMPPADNLTPHGSRSLADQAGEATCGNGSSVRAKPLETDGMTEAGGANANSPPLSASSENGKASNWKGRL